MSENLGYRIKIIRESRGMSLKQAASAIGVSRRHLWDMEEGFRVNPTLKTLRRIAAGFGVSVGELLDDD